MKKHFLKIIILLLSFLHYQKAAAQFNATNNQTAQQLVNQLTGTGIIVLNPTLNCPTVSNGTFKIQTGGSSNLGIDSGIVLSSGTMTGAFGAQVGAGPGLGTSGPAVDADLSTLVTQSLNDLCKLEFDFVPAGDSIKFDYVFASTEYQGFSCSSFNDVFGFFISGGAFTTPFNMATIPGTSIPICVNSTTGVPANPGPLCTSMGTGSPFSQYYIDNTGGATIAFEGFTQIFTAQAMVSPCDTYHLKLAIADCSDGALDSDVFLKAGSLSSSALRLHTYGGGGLEIPYTNTVRGCPDGVVRVSRSGGNLNQPAVIPLSYAGTAVPGVDYTALPASITMNPGDTVISLNVHGLPAAPAVGPKSVIINIFSPYSCGLTPLILASDTITILDSIYVKIINPDTAICIGHHVDLFTQADSTLNFNWTPAATVSNPTGKNVTVTPITPTNYTVAVTLPAVGTACPSSTASVFVDVKVTPVIDLGPDKVTCGDAIQLNATVTPPNPDETFSWTPTATLNNPNIQNPIATPLATTYYVLTVNPGAVGCNGIDSVKVRLLPNHITVLNNDTVVCAGTIIPLRADGDTAFSYNWTPEINVANPLLPNTTLNAQTSGYYTLTASYPGCLPMPDSFHLEVQPVPNVSIGADKVICSYDTLQLYGSVVPANYPNYTFAWSPGTELSDSTVKNPVFSGDNSVQQLTLKVTTPIGCTGSDTMQVIVYQGDFLQVAPEDTGACPPARIQLASSGAETYSWSPAYGLSATDIANPVAAPGSSTNYSLLGSKTYNGHVCYDTGFVAVHVYPSAVVNLPDSVQIWPGESYQMDPQGNCLYFQWFPPSGLSAANISNPTASPAVRTRYFVTATTENGCVIKDSIDVLVNTETAINIPNAFSPGSGDFKIVKRGLATLQYFRIFNRWGNKVFETTNIDQGWDGTYNGQPQPTGVYIYTVDALTSTGVPFKKNGNVTLIR